MIVKNPIDQEITIRYKGTEFTVEANGELAGVPDEAAHYWQDRLHSFIEIEAESKPKKVVEEKIVVPTEPTEPVQAPKKKK